MVRITPLPHVAPPPPPAAAAADPPQRRALTSPAKLPTPAELYVESLPSLSTSSRLTLFAGNLPSTFASNPPSAADSDAHLYFLLARQKHIPKRQRLLLWFNGGPGCSSFDGAMIEVGPLRVNDDGSLREVSGWNEYSSVLFLDQPAGTGFSYVNKNDNVRELAEAADQVVNFLANLYKLFPEFIGMDTYLAGESYAGQYIPYIADAILESTLISTPLKGLIIGNGWISPREQYPAYLDYVLEKGLVQRNSKGHKDIAAAVDKCEKEIAAMDKKDPSSKGMVLVGVCENILGAINAATMKDTLCMNQYDTTLYTTCGQEWPPDLPQVTKYLRRKDVIKALHAEEGAKGKPWTQCSGTVGSHFWTPNSQPAISLFPKLLETLPILLFAGERDLMCAGVGIESMISKLEWNGAVGFDGAEALDWTVDSRLAGKWTSARNLTYVNVYNASHMVPMDQPLASHDMLLRFMQVDTLHAAGPAARVPSRIGKETEAVLGATHPNGTTLQAVEEAAKAKELAEAAEKDVTEDGFDKDHELTYGPRRTAVLFLFLVIVVVAVWVFFRWRSGRRREKYRKLKGKGRAIRLEHGNESRADLSAAAREARAWKYQDRPPVPVEPVETVPVFDVGEEDDYDDESDDDPESQGDLGKAASNPWV